MTSDPILSHARPPGPGALQALSLGKRMRHDSPAVFSELQRTWGDVVRLHVPLVPGGSLHEMHAVFHPDAIANVLVHQESDYGKGYSLELGRVLGKGLVNSEGDLWLRQRKAVGAKFSPQALSDSISSMVTVVDEVIDRWDCNKIDGATVDITDEVQKVAFQISCHILFGMDLTSESQRVRDNLGYALYVAFLRISALYNIPIWVPTPRHVHFAKAMRELVAVIENIMKRYLAGEALPGDNVLARLMAGAIPGDPASLLQVRDEIMTALMVSHETSSAAMAWTLHNLAAHPAHAEALTKEVDSVLGGSKPTSGNLQSLVMVRQFIEETLRLKPSIPAFTRVAKKDVTLAGYGIPSGATIWLVPYVTHRHPDFWDDPETFDPTRFTPEKAQQRNRFAYFPFSHGKRSCIGEYMAMGEAQALVIRILQRFRLEPIGDSPKYQSYITLRPAGKVLARVFRR